MDPTQNEEVLKKIQERIRGETPHSRLYGKLLRYSKVGAVFALVCISALALSLFFVDIAENIKVHGFSDTSLARSAAIVLFDLLIISALGIAGIYLIYRHTDWPFVKERFGLAITALLIVATLSAGAAALSEYETTPLGNFLDRAGDQIEGWLPFHAYLDSLGEQDVLYFEGTVTAVEKDGVDYQIVVAGDAGSKRFRQERRLGLFSVGDRVRLHYQDEGDAFDIEDIERLP